ncbi:hypothetical protein [Microbacterium sp. 18062]|uniref:aggregation-promoting factor C-terminal-like domain-containing protein n=1 Tax=Microbacterium sp. 18062 TaxID=2681410 RepID=UPI0027D1F2F9|nr:hypothetical protein [Microbacterium sp. 18062]
MPARSSRSRLTLAAAALLLAVGLPLAAPAAASAASAPTPSGDLSAAEPEPEALVLDTDFFLTIARATVASSTGKTDVSGLQARIAYLEDPDVLDVPGAAASVEALRAATTEVAQARNAYDAAVAAEAAAAEAAAAKAAADLAQANTPDGARATARQLAAERYGWGDDQFSCLDSLWQKESGWDYQAYNASSGATGIPQSLPGSKMAEAGADWQTVAATQISWGLDYISRGYGTPCSAWSHSQATNWY